VGSASAGAGAADKPSSHSLAAGYVTVASGGCTAVLTGEQAGDERVLPALEHERARGLGAPAARGWSDLLSRTAV